MVAIQTEREDISIFELLDGSDLEIGHKVFWNDPIQYGSTKITNINNNEVLEVYFQHHGLSQASYKGKLLY
ncbi:MAG: hypothetical protein HYZ42_10815 [Bacteroidetes bacterium]|nr:hypothetical protein [Bacteroidota bacterium]